MTRGADEGRRRARRDLRALLYRHFPSKRDLFAALYQQVAEQLLARTRLDPAETLVEQLAERLDAHIEYFAENRNTVLAANPVLAGDRLVQTIINDELDALPNGCSACSCSRTTAPGRPSRAC